MPEDKRLKNTPLHRRLKKLFGNLRKEDVQRRVNDAIMNNPEVFDEAVEYIESLMNGSGGTLDDLMSGSDLECDQNIKDQEADPELVGTPTKTL